MDLKKVKKIIFASGDSNCITEFAENFGGDTIGLLFNAYVIYSGKKFERLEVTHYYDDDVLKLIENGDRDTVAEIENDTYDCFVDFDNFEIDDFKGRFENLNRNEVIIDGVKIPCEIVGDEFDYYDFISNFEELI